jgi:hypothetical protein
VIAPVTPTNAATLTYSVAFGEPVTGLGAVDFDRTGTASNCVVGTPTGSGKTWTVDVTGCSDGTVDLALRANSVIDAAGNAGPASVQTAATVVRDTTAPTFTNPIAVVLRTGVSLPTVSATSAIPVTVSWLAADNAAGSGLDHYTLQRSVSGGAWTTVALTTPQTTSLATTAPSMGTVVYRAQACDVTANCTLVWSTTARLSPRITQQSSAAVMYRGSWYLIRSASVSGGTIAYSKIRNAYTTYTFTGRAIGFVAVKSSIRGVVKVYIDGRYRGQVNLYKTGASQTRLLAWQIAFATSGRHTIKLVVAGTLGHPRVDIDAFVVMK